MELQFPFLKEISNLNKGIVGAPPSNKFRKIKHLKPMLSLSNTFDKIQGRFLKKINNFLNLKNQNIEIFRT